jgi:hypothetical protein
VSAIWTVQEALDSAFLGDGALAPLLKGDKVYSGIGPSIDDSASDGSLLPYILLSNSAESRWPLFETPAFTGTETISIWSAKLHKKEVATLAAHVVRILSLPLSLDGYNFVTGEPTIIALGIDPATLKYSRAVIQYEVMSHAA